MSDLAATFVNKLILEFETTQRLQIEALQNKGDMFNILENVVRSNDLLVYDPDRNKNFRQLAEEIQQIQPASGQPIQIPVFDVSMAQPTGTRLMPNPTGTSFGASSFVNPSVYIGDVKYFDITPNDFLNNAEGYDRVLRILMDKTIENIHNDLETFLISLFESGKSEVNNGRSGTFDNVADLMTVPNTLLTKFPSRVATDMMSNFISGQFLMAGSLGLMDLVNDLNQNKENQAVFMTEQLLGFDIQPSNKILDGSGNFLTSYVMKKGTFAFQTWNRPDHRANTVQFKKSSGKADVAMVTIPSPVIPNFYFDLMITTIQEDDAGAGPDQQAQIKDIYQMRAYGLGVQAKAKTVGANQDRHNYKYALAA